MDIILLQNIDKVGGKFELVKVKDGYARNYLIPRKMALIANDTNRRRLDDLKRREAAKLAKTIDDVKAIAEKLSGVTLKIGAKAGTSGKIFGSVTNIQLAQAILEQAELEIDRKVIDVPEEAKTLGIYTAKINLHPDVDTSVKFEVVEE